MSSRTETVPAVADGQITYLLEKMRAAQNEIAQLRRDLDGLADSETSSVPKCRAKGSANQLIGAGWTTITLDQSSFDTAGMHVGNTVVATIEGYYHMYAALEWAANVTGYRAMRIILNGGSTQLAKIVVPPVTGGDVTGMSCTTSWYLNRNEYIELQGWQNSGGSLNSISGAEYAPVLGMELIPNAVIAAD